MIKNRYTGKCLEKIKANLYLYQLMVFLRGQLNYNHWPTSETEITIEAYGRSGNTYLVELIKRLKPRCERRIASHSHSFGVVKYSIKRRIPTIILLRNPLDVIASACLKDGLFDKEGIDFHLVQYYGFYNRINDELKLGNDKLIIIDSKELFESSDLFLEKLRVILKIEIDEDCFIEASNDSKDYLDSQNRHRLPLERSLSNAEKQKGKESISLDIKRSKYYTMATTVHQSLITKQ
jgi:hypothetical protein